MKPKHYYLLSYEYSGSTSTNTFGALSLAYGGSGWTQTDLALNQRFRTYPNNFLFSGNVDGSSVDYRGSNGLWWSQSAYSAPGAYYLRLYNNGYVNPSDGGHKWGGVSVRCFAGS